MARQAPIARVGTTAATAAGREPTRVVGPGPRLGRLHAVCRVSRVAAAAAVAAGLAATGASSSATAATNAATLARPESHAATLVRPPPRPAAPVRRPSHAAYTVAAGTYRPVAHFAVSYSGGGTWATTYHSIPPNPGGMHDTNDAADSSTQAWSLEYLSRLTVPVCSPVGRNARDPCARISGPKLARGPTSVVGRVDHTHVDGLYAFDDATARCQLTEAPTPATPLALPLHVTYDALRQTVTIAPADPIAQALALIVPACPGYVDGIDGLAGNYFTPGFSFNPAYGADRWFAPAPVTIRLATLHRAARITVPLGPTAAGTPPVGCAVRTPAVEQCHTTGTWRGILTLSAVA